jgi:NADH-quinone oxidoreductase subunit L
LFYATLGGLISLPTNSWLNEYLLLYLQKATEEHHFGTSEYLLMLVAVIGLVGIGIAYAKYIKQNQVPDEDAAITGFTKCYDKYYVDEIYDFYS